MDFNSLMAEVLKAGAPDLHLHVGQYPIVRMKTGSIAALNTYPILSKEDVEAVINKITNEEQRKVFEKNHEFDFSFSFGDLGRFRVNIYQERFGPAVAFRIIAQEIPTLADLGLGSAVERMINFPYGLILVTGPTGSGKSTSLAAMINYINEHRSAHVITIEDPIEYVYKSKNCLITQREVNVHTHSFTNAIRSALRQDPDVVLVGEMRDLETIAAALTLAETGHLVFSTLHTQDAPQTIDRIIDVFPSEQQQQIRTQLGSTLKGVVSQVLVPRANGEGRVAAREIMITNDGIRNCIVQGQTNQIYSMIQIGASEGMVLMDESLENLAREGIITKEAALSKAADFESLNNKLDAI
ncbi:type IV pilus twitching motility protein PilT [Patescibacteria group bacterium]|nr:type IV pilus twitching motility protein PilT [Patescibacteria group bacterium]